MKKSIGRREFLLRAGVITSVVAVNPGLDSLDLLERLSSACAASQGRNFFVDASSGDDGNSGVSLNEAWKTVGKVNSATFRPGDRIFFKRGEIFNSGPLYPRNSGIKGNPIIYGAYGKGSPPIIKKSETIPYFKNISSGVWVTVLQGTSKGNTPVNICRNIKTNAILRGRRTNVASLQRAGDFWHDVNNNLFYLFSKFDPSGMIEIPKKKALGYMRKEWLVFEDLHFDLANSFLVQFTASNQMLRRCTLSYSGDSGTQTFGGHVNSCIIEASRVYGCNGNGILINSRKDSRVNWVIQGNDVHNNCMDIIDGRHGYLNYTGGIKVITQGDGRGMIIQHNSVHHNGNVVQKTPSLVKGIGIWVDTWDNGGAIVRYNRVFENTLAGIELELTESQQVYGNLVYRNGTGAPFIDELNGKVGVVCNRGAHKNFIFHNTIYNNTGAQIALHGPESKKQFSNFNFVKNNVAIPVGPDQIALRVFGSKVGDYNGNVIEFNCFGKERQGFIEWGSNLILCNSYAQFERMYRADIGSNLSTHSINAHPEFVDAEHADFHLKPGILGMKVGDKTVRVKHDFEGNQFGSPPTLGAYVSH